MRSEAEARHERLIWGDAVSYPTPVLAVVDADYPSEITASMDENLARRDDAFWLKFTMLPFTWQRFTNWWVARRWVTPRDIRKE